jgi:hypothetical protein
MSHKWEHEDEYLQLKSAFRRAQKDGDMVRSEQLRSRIKELDDLMWSSLTRYFTELAPYQTVTEALEQTAQRLGISFPNLADPSNNSGDGHFMFGVSDGVRTVQIWPLESRGYYDIEVYRYDTPSHEDEGLCYRGQTTSLEEAILVLSWWFVKRCSIEMLHAQFPWIPHEPFHLSGPRVTFG